MGDSADEWGIDYCRMFGWMDSLGHDGLKGPEGEGRLDVQKNDRKVQYYLVLNTIINIPEKVIFIQTILLKS